MALTAHISNIFMTSSMVVTINDVEAKNIPAPVIAAKIRVTITTGGLVVVSRMNPMKNNAGNMNPDHANVSSYRSSKYIL